MIIKNFKVEGFRSLKNLNLDLMPVNILIGPNSSGKSNIISALELLSDAVSGKLRDAIMKKHGGMIPILWNGTAKEIGFEATIRSHRFGFNENPEENASNLVKRRYVYSLRLEQLRASSEYGIELEKLHVENIANDDDLFNYTGTIINRDGKEYFTKEINSDIPAAVFDIFKDSESMFFNMDSIKNGWKNYTELQIYRFINFFNDCSFYRNLNHGPEAEARHSTVTRSEKVLESNGDNLIAVLHTLYTGNKEFEEQLNNTLEAAFGDDFEELTFPPLENGRVYMKWRSKTLNRELSPADLSDGTILFLMLSAILLSPEPPPIICIDEPELGMHPSMLGIIAELIKDASNRTQLIVSTHSPELLSAFSDMPESVVVVEKEDGATTAKRLDRDSLSKWLEEYTLGRLWLDREIGG